MDPDTLRIAQMAVIIVMFTGGVATIVVGTKLVLQWASRRARVSPPADDPRLERIEQAVEAIAIEVERISEAQRFTARVAAERAPDRLPEPRPTKSITPH